MEGRLVGQHPLTVFGYQAHSAVLQRKGGGGRE
jgi:hypothetical protein